MNLPEEYNQLPANVNEAKKELDALRIHLFKFRRWHWVFWWGVGIIFFGISAFYFKGWRFLVLITGSLVSLVLVILAWKGIINPSIPRGSTEHTQDDDINKRIAFLEGYIESHKNNSAV